MDVELTGGNPETAQERERFCRAVAITKIHQHHQLMSRDHDWLIDPKAGRVYCRCEDLMFGINVTPYHTKMMRSKPEIRDGYSDVLDRVKMKYLDFLKR